MAELPVAQQKLRAHQMQALEYQRETSLALNRGQVTQTTSLKEAVKHLRPPSLTFFVLVLILVVIADLGDIIAALVELGVSPTIVGPLIPAGVSAIVDTLVLPFMLMFGYYIQKKTLRFIEFQNGLQNGFVVHEKKQRIKKITELVKKNDALPTIDLKKGKAAKAYTAIANPTQFLSMFKAYGLDLVLILEAWPFRTLLTWRAFFQCRETYRSLLRNWEEYQKML